MAASIASAMPATPETTVTAATSKNDTHTFVSFVICSLIRFSLRWTPSHGMLHINTYFWFGNRQTTRAPFRFDFFSWCKGELFALRLQFNGNLSVNNAIWIHSRSRIHMPPAQISFATFTLSADCVHRTLLTYLFRLRDPPEKVKMKIERSRWRWRRLRWSHRCELYFIFRW